MCKRKLLLLFLLSTFIVVGPTACKKSSNNKALQGLNTFTVKKESVNTPLYFSGNIQPLQVINVVSPVDGHVDKINFTQGEKVDEGQALMSIRSSKLLEDFQSAVSDYLSKKDDHTNKEQKLKSDKELHDLGFISDDDYTASQVSEKESYVSLLLSRFKLEKILKSAQVDMSVTNIDFANRDAVIKLLEKKLDTVTLFAPATGIAIAPTKSGGSSGGDSGSDDGVIMIGSEVKQDNPVIAIGDLSGVTVGINVTEAQINQIHQDQKVTVSGPAFEQYTLNGVVDTVQTQAKQGDQGLPTFPVTIKVKDITPDERNVIHIGMTAQVAITLITPDVIMIPLDAVTDKNGTPVVTVKDPKTSQLKEVPVTTGNTTEDSVEIQSGLNPGDVIVYHN